MLVAGRLVAGWRLKKAGTLGKTARNSWTSSPRCWLNSLSLIRRVNIGAMRAGCTRASSFRVRSERNCLAPQDHTRGSLYIFGTDAFPFSIFTR